MTTIYQEDYPPAKSEIERLERNTPLFMPEPNTRCTICAENIYGVDAISFDVYTGMPDLFMHPACAESLAVSLVQDLARVVDARGFVVGTYLSAREDRVLPALEKLLLAGRAQTLPKHE